MSSNPDGIDCGTTCSHDFETGTVVTLTAVASPGSKFNGWRGDCAGSQPGCTLTMDVDRAAEALFGVDVGGSSVTRTIPVVTHAPGEKGTTWRSGVVVLNDAGQSAQVTFTVTSGLDTYSQTATIEAGRTLEWADVLVDLFGLSSETPVSGSLRIQSNRRLGIVSRTYNQAAEGTFGQYLPALDAEADGLAESGGYLLHLKGGEDFRTNLGFIAFADQGDVTLLVSLRDADGDPVGTPFEIVVAAGTWIPANDVFRQFGIDPLPLAWATVEWVSGTGHWWAYASVVDNHTGDATTIPILPW